MKVSKTTRRLLAQRRANRERRATSPPAPSSPMMREIRDTGAFRLRRWESADTHRLNRAHWQLAQGRTINEDLLERLENLRIRSEYEVANNPIVEGIVSTFSNDVVGPDGPRIQIQSDNDKYNREVEAAIAEYSERPDPTREAMLADTLKVDIRSIFTAGEFLHQFTSMRRRGPFSFAIRSPHPRRLESPADKAGQPDFFMGIQLELEGAMSGAPIKYYFRDEPPGLYARSVASWRAVDAQNIQHRFIAHEPDQLRGFPWLAVALDDIADLRDLNKFVMESAKNAAAQGVLWYTDHPAAMVQLNLASESHPLEPGMQQAGPPGYKPFMVSPTQPSAQWKEFYHEKLRGHGRPIGMPLMMILLSSEGNSFSGANHDGQIYIRSVQSMQAWLWSGTLRPQIRQIEQEVIITTGLRRPEKVEYAVTWPLPPHPDPKKNYEALRMQLEDGAISLQEVCASLGRDFESIQQARDYVNKVLEKFNLPPAPINLGNAGGKPADVLRKVAAKLDEADTMEADDGEFQGKEKREPAEARA